MNVFKSTITSFHEFKKWIKPRWSSNWKGCISTGQGQKNQENLLGPRGESHSAPGKGEGWVPHTVARAQTLFPPPPALPDSRALLNINACPRRGSVASAGACGVARVSLPRSAGRLLILVATTTLTVDKGEPFIKERTDHTGRTQLLR